MPPMSSFSCGPTDSPANLACEPLFTAPAANIAGSTRSSRRAGRSLCRSISRSRRAWRTVEESLDVSLADLMHWDIAPENPARLDAAGVTFALTSHGLRDQATFLAAVRRAVERGLKADSALEGAHDDAGGACRPERPAGQDRARHGRQSGRHRRRFIREN